MAIANLNPGRLTGIKIVASQGLLAVIIGIVAWLMVDARAGYSALVGGLVCVVANFYFVLKAFSHAGARAAKKIMRAFYYAQAAKIGITAGLFALAFIWGDVSPLPFLLGYVLTQLGFWLSALFFN